MKNLLSKIPLASVFVFLLSGGAALLMLQFAPVTLRLSNFQTKDFVAFFTELTAVALFVERAIEVFITPWREEDARKKSADSALARKVVQAQLQQKPPSSSTGTPPVPDEASLSRAETSTAEEVAYRSGTQRIAFVVSLAAGIAISLVGLRALEFFLNPEDLKALASSRPGQLAWLHVVDIVLTGAVISGGADGLHKIVTVFTNFADSTSQKMKTT
jgi:hypothetical protein